MSTRLDFYSPTEVWANSGCAEGLCGWAVILGHGCTALPQDSKQTVTLVLITRVGQTTPIWKINNARENLSAATSLTASTQPLSFMNKWFKLLYTPTVGCIFILLVFWWFGAVWCNSQGYSQPLKMFHLLKTYELIIFFRDQLVDRRTCPNILTEYSLFPLPNGRIVSCQFWKYEREIQKILTFCNMNLWDKTCHMLIQSIHYINNLKLCCPPMFNPFIRPFLPTKSLKSPAVYLNLISLSCSSWNKVLDERAEIIIYL